MATLGTLSGQTLTYGVDKYIVLSGSFAVTYEPMGTKYLVTITLEDSKHICVLSVQDFISLLQLQQKENEKLKEEENKKLKEENEKQKENEKLKEEENKKLKENEKLKEEENKKLKEENKKLKEAEDCKSNTYARQPNSFSLSAASLKEDNFKSIIEKGKISCNPYFVKILHNYLYLQKLAAAKSDSAQDKREIIDDSVKNTPKLIEEFYDIVAEYKESWEKKCSEIDKITEEIFYEISTIDESFRAQNESTFNSIIAAPFNNTLAFVKSLNNCGIRYKKHNNSGRSENNPVTPDMLLYTEDQTNIIIEFKYGKNNNVNVNAKYQAAGYVVSIADFYRQKSSTKYSRVYQ